MPAPRRACRDYRPAWKVNITEQAAGNYYPLTAAMYIQDSTRQVALLTERAQGGLPAAVRGCNRDAV